MAATTSLPQAHARATNRWLVPLGAVCVHICLGSIYAWSTFTRAMEELFKDVSWFNPTYATYSTALALLGLTAAFAGPWVERRGPRVAATAAALLSGTGLLIGGVGLAFQQAVLVFLGMGVIAGIGWGLGYIAPVSVLVKWFPDRRGMATGMAIMGFGAGSFLSGRLNATFVASVGVANTVLIMAGIYLVVMLIGARLLRRPPEGWKPEGWNPLEKQDRMIATSSVNRNQAVRTPQFVLLWCMLFINVTAGIGILAQASPMLQDLFQMTPIEAGTVVSLLSIFNAGGRFVWSSTSDYIGRTTTYRLFFLAQIFVFLLIPGFASGGNPLLFEIALCVAISMYGGGFATIPAFLADIFGPENIGAIHGATLTAWSAAAIVGPVTINELSARAKAGLAPGASLVHIYDSPLQVLAGLLAVGFVLTLLIKPLKRA